MNRARAPTPPLSVLVVDGYPDAEASLALLLALEGFATRASQFVEEVLAAVVADPPDVVILEPRTPGWGWELTRRLGVKVAGKQPLLVALTTDTTPTARRAADAAGIDLYLVKPADPAVLVGLLRRFEQTTGGVMPSANRVYRLPRRRAGISAIPRECPAGRALAGV